MQGDSGRLQRIETTLGDMRETMAQLAAGQKYTHEELKKGTRVFEQHDARLESVEKVTASHATHLTWVKWLGSAVATTLGGIQIFGGKH